MVGEYDFNEAYSEDDDRLLVDVDELDDAELRMIAEKVMALLQQDARIGRERHGLRDHFPGW